MAKADYRNLERRLRDLGYEIETTGGNHRKILAPRGPVFWPSTCSDRRGLKNTVAQLRRAGVAV